MHQVSCHSGLRASPGPCQTCGSGWMAALRQKRPVTITFPEERLTSSPPWDCVGNLDHACEPQFIDLRAAQSEQPLEYLVVSSPSPSPSQLMCPGVSDRHATTSRTASGPARDSFIWILPRARYCGFSRIYPRRRAICAALRPAAQSFLSNATSSASQPMGDAIQRLLTTGWSTPGLPGESIPAWHSRGCTQPLISSAGHLTLTEIPKRTVQR